MLRILKKQTERGGSMNLDDLFNFNLKQKKTLWFYIFISPFIIGFILFFIQPFIQAIIFSLNKLQLSGDGFELTFVGLKNYKYAFTVHPEFNREFIETIVKTISDIPSVLVFSFMAAYVLNQKFKGRMVARTIFFLPVIMGAGVVLRLEQTDFLTQVLGEGFEDKTAIFSEAVINNILLTLQLPEVLLNYILEAINYVPQIIRASGVQILIFLAGLQSIPSSLYESSKIDGATNWENFWLITLPMLSPIILTNIVYTVIDSFTAGGNPLVDLIKNTAFEGAGYGVSSAMAIFYFISIAMILAIILKIISRWVFYQK